MRWLIAVLALWCAPLPCLAADAMASGSFEGTVLGFGQGHAQIMVAANSTKLTLLVPATALQTRLESARVGDNLAFVVDNAVKPTALTELTSITRPVAQWTVLWTMLFSAASVIGLSLLFLWGRNPLVGVDNRYSNSQTQLALWFATVATVYLSANILRAFELGGDFIGGIALTQHVMVLTGLSAMTFGAAKVVATQKAGGQPPQAAAVPGAAADAVATEVPAAAAVRKTMALKPQLADLVLDDQGHADLGDLQMIFITLAAVIIFLCRSYWWLTALPVSNEVILPDVDTALLATFGIGQGAYLFKKAAIPGG